MKALRLIGIGAGVTVGVLAALAAGVLVWASTLLDDEADYRHSDSGPMFD